MFEQGLLALAEVGVGFGVEGGGNRQAQRLQEAEFALRVGAFFVLREVEQLVQRERV